jgi:hypothetical protein
MFGEHFGCLFDGVDENCVGEILIVDFCSGAGSAHVWFPICSRCSQFHGSQFPFGLFPSLFILYGMVFEGIGEWGTWEAIREYISYKRLTRD